MGGNRFAPPLTRIPLLEINSLDSVWIACALDAEGTISVHRNLSRRVSRGYQYEVILSVSNTNKAFAEKAQRILSDEITVGKERRQWKPVYVVRLHSLPKIYALLKIIMPHLIIKAKHAELVMEFIEEQDKAVRARVKWGCIPYTDRQHQIYEEVSSLQKANGKSRKLGGES